MKTDEITLFREGRPDVPEYDRMAKARMRVRLLNEAESPARSRSLFGRRRLLVAGVLAGAAVAAGVVVAGPGGQGGGGGGPAVPDRLRTVAGPEDLAHNAALVAATEPIAKSPRWAYVKTVFAGTREGGGKPGKTLSREIWRRTDGKRFAVVEGGRLKVANGSKAVSDGVRRLDYPYLLSLPDRPAELLARIYKAIDADHARSVAAWNEPIPKDAPARTRAKLKERPKPVPPTAEERNARAFELISLHMRDAVLPARIRAALYGAAAKIPGVRYEPRATDIAGRKGVTLYRMEGGYLRSEIIVDPKSYAYLGFRIVAIKDHRPVGLVPVKKGEVVGWGGLVESGFVAKPGQRP
ncbi:CU044_5270 family protein [Actinomadura sp. 21ATH]|uniref:CU044_5270 family protein n=1 Tax=Actinomadura sp. 21ATH TaxID=1735444 RepID=UPI0035C1263C